MRREHDVLVEGEERVVVRRRLDLKDIERAAGDVAGINGSLQGWLIDQAAAGAVHNQCTLVHQGKAVGIENVVGFRGERHVHRDDICTGEGNLGCGGKFHLQLVRAGLREERIVGDHVHVEGLGALGELGTNAAHAEDGEALGVELNPLISLAGSLEVTLQHRGMGGADIAGGAEHQSESVLGGRNGVAGRRIHHDHAVIGGGLAVDVVHADARAADCLEIVRGGQHLGGHLGFGADHQSMVVADDLQQLVRFESCLYIDRDAGSGCEGFNAFFRDRIRNEHAVSGHVGRAIGAAGRTGKSGCATFASPLVNQALQRGGGPLLCSCRTLSRRGLWVSTDVPWVQRDRQFRKESDTARAATCN